MVGLRDCRDLGDNIQSYRGGDCLAPCRVERYAKSIKSSVLFVSVVLLFVVFGNNVAFGYSQAEYSTVSSSVSASNIQVMGTGLSGNVDTITIFANVPSDTAINNGILWLIEYDDNSYTCTYPCGTNKTYSTAIAVSPSNRLNDNIISGGAGVVEITGNFSKTLNPSKYYALGYYGTDLSHKLKVYGSTSDTWANGSYRWGNDGNYPRVDALNTYSQTGNGLSDMFFSINGELPPTFLVSGSESVNILNGVVSVDLSGDLRVVDEQYYAKIKVWSVCSADGKAGYSSQTPDVVVQVDAEDCNTTTRKVSTGFYEGEEYCNATDTTTWSADRVELPYPSGYTCDYPVTYCIYQRQCEFISEFSGYSCADEIEIECGELGTIDLTTDTSGTDYTVDEPPKTDPFGWLGWKIGQIISDAFSFNGVDMSNVATIKNELSTRAPFAYATAIFGMDWSTSAGSSTPPAMTFAFASNGGGLVDNYVYNSNSVVDNLLGLIRPVFSVGLWLSFIAYVVIRVRGLILTL